MSTLLFVTSRHLLIMYFSVGGYDGQNFLNTVECYDPLTNQWSVLNPMTCRRSKLLCLMSAVLLKINNDRSCRGSFNCTSNICNWWI